MDKITHSLQKICPVTVLKFHGKKIQPIVVCSCCNISKHFSRYIIHRNDSLKNRHFYHPKRKTSIFFCFLTMKIYLFSQDPFNSFNIPIKNMENWFEISTVTKKRRDIVDIIKEKIARGYGRNNYTIEDLPEIQLPE